MWAVEALLYKHCPSLPLARPTSHVFPPRPGTHAWRGNHIDATLKSCRVCGNGGRRRCWGGGGPPPSQPLQLICSPTCEIFTTMHYTSCHVNHCLPTCETRWKDGDSGAGNYVFQPEGNYRFKKKKKKKRMVSCQSEAVQRVFVCHSCVHILKMKGWNWQTGSHSLKLNQWELFTGYFWHKFEVN